MSWRRAVSYISTLGTVALLVWFWPASLGGATRVVMVAGESMEPGYHLGDLVVARERSASAVGDIVVFQVPDGAGEGELVIHRIVAVRDDGSFVTKGDSRAVADQFHVTADDIVGEPVLRIPWGGHLIALMRQGWFLAAVSGVLTAILLWPRGRSKQAEAASEEVADDGSAPTVDLPLVDDPSVVAEAEAWLAEQLAQHPMGIEKSHPRRAWRRAGQLEEVRDHLSCGDEVELTAELHQLFVATPDGGHDRRHRVLEVRGCTR